MRISFLRVAPTVLALLLGAAGCVHGSEPSPAETKAVPRCPVGFSVPRGFEGPAVQRFPEGDHVGIRATYRDGRRLVALFSGVTAEFTEHARFFGRVSTTSDRRAELYGSGQILDADVA